MTKTEKKIYQKNWKAKNPTYFDIYRKNNKQYIKEWHRKYRDTLYRKVSELYSNGTMKCICGNEIEEHHHSNGKDAKKERILFGGQCNGMALNYQIEMYNKNKSYILPLCKKCHMGKHGKKSVKK